MRNLLTLISPSSPPSIDASLFLLRYFPLSLFLSVCSLCASLNLLLITARVRFSRKKAPMNTRGTKKRKARDEKHF